MHRVQWATTASAWFVGYQWNRKNKGPKLLIIYGDNILNMDMDTEIDVQIKIIVGTSS